MRARQVTGPAGRPLTPGESPVALKTKHTHYLLSSGPTTFLDAYATLLALASRGGRYPLIGPHYADVRRLLAAKLDGGELAELLASGRPILVDAGTDHYRIEEV